MKRPTTHHKRFDPRTDWSLRGEDDGPQTQGNGCVEPLERVHEVRRLYASAVVNISYVGNLPANFGEAFAEPAKRTEVLTKTMLDLRCCS